MANKLTTVADVTVTTAGTRVQVTATSTLCESILFQGHPSNTGKVYVGDSNVSATRGTSLDAKIGYTVASNPKGDGSHLFDLSDYWVDAQTNGEKVKVSYVAAK